MRQRKNVNALKHDEPERLAQAFDSLMKSGEYRDWIALHAKHGRHLSALFLPWHRAFILEFENALRRAVPDVTLPYWDWVANPSLPCLLQDHRLVIGRHDDASRQRGGLSLPSLTETAEVMKNVAFIYFGGSGCDRFSLCDSGSLENIHGRIHKWVGPAMSELVTAVEDPAFWLLHSNVDRLWDLWQREHKTELPCPDHQLEGLQGRVADMISASALDYQYIGAEAPPAEPWLLPWQHLDLQVPPPSRRLELRVRGLRLTGDGRPPAEVLIVRDDTNEVVARISLFGLTHQGDGEHDHGHGHVGDAGLNIRLDVTAKFASDSGPAVALHLQVHRGLEPDPLRQVEVDSITLVAVDV